MDGCLHIIIKFNVDQCSVFVCNGADDVICRNVEVSLVMMTDYLKAIYVTLDIKLF